MPAKSKNQQEFFGMALSVKRGETSRSEVSDDVLKVVDNMSEKEIRDFAKTKHKGLPTKVKEQKIIKLKDLLEWAPGDENILYKEVEAHESKINRTAPHTRLKDILESLRKRVENRLPESKVSYSMGGMARGQTARMGRVRDISVNVHLDGDDLTTIDIPLKEPLSNDIRDLIGKLRRAGRTGYRI